MLFDWSSQLVKAQITGLLLTCLSNFLIFIALVTPAWQVAEDLDAGRYVQSGLWMYCPGSVQCWYIFSDNLINYYEKVDICRFLLIGDCRKKLIRTPYFFGWHYAVLILVLLALLFGSIAAVSLTVSTLKPARTRPMAVVYDIFSFLSFLSMAIGLAVFMINAEMLESRYLIGVKNIFKKEYGYSFYLAGLALLVLLLSMLAGVMLTTYVFFTKSGRNFVDEIKRNGQPRWRVLTLKPFKTVNSAHRRNRGQLPVIPVFENVFDHPPRPGSSNAQSQSITPLPTGDFASNTRSFFSY